MSVGVVMLLFLVSLAVMLGATDRLVRDLDQIGLHLHLSDGLLGLLTALGADAPEISSASVAMQSGHHEIGLGVILGSNLFNLAALLGLGAILAGRVVVKQESLLLDGGVGLVIMLLTATLILQLVPPSLCALLLACVLIPYVAALALPPFRLSQLPLPARWSARLAVAVRALDQEAAQDPRIAPIAPLSAAMGGSGPRHPRSGADRRRQCGRGADGGHRSGHMEYPGAYCGDAALGRAH